MVKFINLENGLVYNGDQPFIHWFEGECSTGLIYSKNICILSDTPTLNVSLNSDIFSLVDTTNIEIDDEVINDFSYKNINNIKVKSISSAGILYNNLYIHLIYVVASAQSEAEYLDEIYINGNPYTIGIDVYMNNETLNINLSNFGINIPDIIQKSIYPADVHEDKQDNILLNRKWKELISNYWDVIANKGSYKSLINSLKWFEWPNINMKELWKYNDLDKTILEERDLKTILENYYKDTLCRFAKTTYISISHAMQDISSSEYDDQGNPLLKQMIHKWSKEDIMLKLSLLGNFYETYFMPIHLDLIHCTIEDVVFTNSFKTFNWYNIGREDNILPSKSLSCNVKDGDIFILSNTSCQVGPDTMFGTIYNGEKNYEDIDIVGVDFIVDDIKNDYKTFWTQLYNSIGVVVPFNIEINTSNEFIKSSLISIYKNGKWLTRQSNKIFHPQDNIINIDFNILFENEGISDVKMQFISSTDQVYTYNAQINIKDISSIHVKLCKLRHNNFPRLEDWYGDMSNNYNISRIISNKSTPDNYIQYIPIPLGDHDKNNSIALNNILIFKSESQKESGLIDFAEAIFWVNKKYFVTHKKLQQGNKYILYTICVSKEFWYDPNADISEYIQQYVYRNDYGYFPEFHHLVELNGSDLNDFIISNDEVLCLVPVFKNDIDETPFYIGKNVSGVEWEFENISTGEFIKLPVSIQEPFILNDNKSILSKGYYNIHFRYKIGNEQKYTILNSAFIKS